MQQNMEVMTLPSTLTDPQREAVLHADSPLLIIAGPGSGKTEVISWRVAHLVNAGRAGPDEILALTFTRKASLELKDRIQRKLPQANAELMQISTFHSFCSELLRRYPRQAGLPNGYQILEDSGKFLFVYSRRRELGLETILKGRPQDFYKAVIGAFDKATEEQVTPGALADWYRQNLDCCRPKDAPLWQERQVVAEAYAGYCRLLQQEGFLDFAFLQTYALRLLVQHPVVLAELKTQYRELLVDEYQDTNALQERILTLLAGDGRHLTVVGDDDQSIYRFRGATVRNILDFPERYPDTKVVKLVHNFRSRNQIVDHSQQVIAHNPARFDKNLQPVRGPGSEVLLVYEHTAGEEASVTVEVLQQLYHSGRIPHWRDVAILLRSVKSQADAYRDALTAAGIPFQVQGDASFFEREEISQLYDLLKFLGAEKNAGDVYLRHPLVCLSPETCAALKGFPGNLLEIASPEGLAGIGILADTDQRRVLALMRLKQRVQAKQHVSLLEVFYDLLAITGCAARFEQAGRSEALANLGIFSQIIADWDEHGASRSAYPFLEYLYLIKEMGVNPYLPPVDDAVEIMTIHQAKGLEYPVVVLGSAMNERLPARRHSEPYEIPAHLCASGAPEVNDPHLVDERKLFYVAATRARDLLIVGTADVVNKRGGGPSLFLPEMFGADLRAAAQHSLEKIHGIESQKKTSRGPRPRHSFSQLSMFLECPVRYKFAHVHGLEIPTFQPVMFGSNIHRALDVIHQAAIQGRIISDQEVPAIVEDTWVAAPKAWPTAEEDLRQAAVRYLRAYVRDYQADLRRAVKSEMPFSFGLNDQVLQGKIDLVLRGPDGCLEIVDFKTSRQREEELARDAFQLSLYGLGVDVGMGLLVSRLTVHFMRKSQQVVGWDWTEERKNEAKARLSGILTCIEQRQYAPNLEYCRFCKEYRDICPYAHGILLEENDETF
jgi:DNA helicase II / ATP-dependent DNA helicase PcrA